LEITRTETHIHTAFHLYLCRFIQKNTNTCHLAAHWNHVISYLLEFTNQ